ncbi:BRCA1-A complex subunit Abraxas 1 [Bombina bombina]|uniref:BRCA1-A complex subunit Abraxas 1 n=1 Tax=Bombina bombina TaxID=8345 RepID=UPI00235A97C9|nr:BRCA1-A complex subunit Abraxas 1 [Bombina bombina]
MEGESTTALLSGFVFGALAFHHLNSGSDTEGFLLGDVKGEAKNSITDSQMDDVEVIYTIDIQKQVPCYRLSSFYGALGDLNKPALNKLLKGQKKNVIGWYKFRHNTDQTMTFREKILHQNLQEYLSNTELVFLLMTSNATTQIKSTHRMEYALHKPQDGLLQKVPLVVTNLGMSEQQGYKTVSGSCISVGFGRAVKKHRLEFFNEDDSLKEVNKISDMYTTLQEELTNICTNVVESEHSVEKLLEEVNKLKKDIAEKKNRHFPTGEKQVSASDSGENVILCEALRKFFPSSAVLQSCRLSLNGKPIPHHCNVSHNMSVVNQLTLMIKQCDFPETKTKLAGKRKGTESQNGAKAFKKTRLWQIQKLHRTRMEGETSDCDKSLFLSGTETDDDISECANVDNCAPQSPTF